MNAKGYYDELTEEDAPGKIKAVKFELYRAEGLTSECGPASPVTTWKAADDILRRWAATAPDEGQGYDKCDFTVTYADGETYTGRYDLKRHDMGFTDLLAHHIKSYQEFYAGTHRPEWMKESQYADFISKNYSQEAADFLAKYEIGDEESAHARVLVVVHDVKPIPQPKTTKQAPKVTPHEAGKVIHLHELKQGWGSDVYNADILPGKYIRLYGTYKNLSKGPKDYDITFELGDTAEYDSYNLSYTGEIVNIGPKTVTIKHKGYSDRKSRLSIVDFAWRNWDYDAERIAKENSITMQSI